MFNCVKKSAKIHPIPQYVKVIFNNGNCKKCLKNDSLIAIIDDGGSLSYCSRCEINNVIFKMMTIEEYEKIKDKKEIKNNTLENFVSKNVNNVFI